MTQTLDTRNLTTSGEILLEVGATASGLVPELDECLSIGIARSRLHGLGHFIDLAFTQNTARP